LEDDEGGAGELVLFVVLAAGVELDDELRDTIARTLRGQLSPRHVPAAIHARRESRAATRCSTRRPSTRSLPSPRHRPRRATVADRLTLDDVVAIDVHAHVEMSRAGHDSLPDDLRDAAIEHFRGQSARPTAEELAVFYRERRMMAVVFTVDSESTTGQPRVPNEEIAEVAHANADVLVPFASIDPHKGRQGLDEARRLIEEHGVRGFKFHPNVQAFFPNDRMAYPFYEVIEAAGLPVIFPTGHSGVGSGMRGGGGIRLKYSNPI